MSQKRKGDTAVITDKERKNREELAAYRRRELFRLMRENPELPVVPMVDWEITGDDNGYWLGAWGSARIDEYLLISNRELDRLALLPREENFWFGVTATDHQTMMYAMRCLPAWKYNIFISIEPMLGNIKLFEAEQVPSWIVLGAMTGPGSNRHQPKQEWVEALARDAADTAVPVFMKDSLGPIVGEENMLRELPWG